MLGTVGQIGIGILKQTYSDPKLKATLVKAHKWTGITLFIFALVTIALGLQLFGSFSKKNQVPLIIAFMLVILLGGSAFFFGSFFLSPKGR